MEILNLRRTANGYLINGLTETVDGDSNYADALQWEADGKEVMPQYTQAEIDAIANVDRVGEIDLRLNEIDKLSIRSLRSKSNGRGNSQDDTTLLDLDDEAATLRTERGTIAV